MNQFLRKEISTKSATIIIVAVFLIVSGILFLNDKASSPESFSFFKNITFPKIPFVNPANDIKDIKKFASEEEFKIYLENSSQYAAYGGFGIGGEIALERALVAPAAPSTAQKDVERVSETNVQVLGVDESDIVKTDGKEIYLSSNYYDYGGIRPMMIEDGIGVKIMPPYYQQIGTRIIQAFPPADLKVISELKKGGELLLAKNILVIFSGQEISGYNVSDSKSPEKKWNIKLDDNASIAGARLYQNKIYLVVRQNINESRPCPIRPLTVSDVALEIKCVDIYYPIAPVPVDSNFTAMILDPASGKINNTVSFVGSSGSSVVYMSESAIYITYTYYESMIKFFSAFLKEEAGDLVPKWLIDKMNKLESYDISQNAKMTEMQTLWNKYLTSLDNDERLKAENELANRSSDYFKEHSRELEKTGIVKIKLDNFTITASGNVPGSPLNQFSLDEYKNNLRIATTVGGQSLWFAGNIGRGESVSDVYVLDNNLKLKGVVKDLGKTERIYSVRFIENRGYVVTFRQTDPFYVLDLTDPAAPALKGELKIPGYSSYLHPLAKDKILGIGRENWQVKISIFDVSSASNPVEAAKYTLDEGWSETLSNHRAYLQDSSHEVFFLPGGKGGYIFSYKNGKLELTKAISGISAKRALYINDYLYIIGSNDIIVLNEADWQTVNKIDLTE